MSCKELSNQQVCRRKNEQLSNQGDALFCNYWFGPLLIFSNRIYGLNINWPFQLDDSWERTGMNQKVPMKSCMSTEGEQVNYEFLGFWFKTMVG